MAQLNFRSITTGYDVKNLLPSGIKFWEANVCSI